MNDVEIVVVVVVVEIVVVVNGVVNGVVVLEEIGGEKRGGLMNRRNVR
jgi:hypothetical protein